MGEDAFACEIINSQHHRVGMTTAHFHPYFEIYYFLGDTMTFFLGDVSFELQKYDIVPVRKYLYHRTFYPSSGVCRRMNLSFDEGLFKQLGLTEEEMTRILYPFHAAFRIRFLREEDRECLDRLFLRAYDGAAQGVSSQKVFVCAALMELSASLERAQPFDPRTNLSPKENIVYEAISFLNENYKRKISLDELSKRLYVSKYHLCRCFKEITGTGIASYISEKRLNEAQRLLRCTERPVAEICGECGFDSMSNFLEQFKRQYHMPPHAYRANEK